MKPQSTTLRLLLVGNVMLGRLVNGALTNWPPAYPWGDTLPLFEGADWRCCNLQCVISDRGQPWPGTPAREQFRSDALNVAALSAAQIDAVSLANNHTFDFKDVALRDMLRLLDDAGIAHSGAGPSLVAAANPAITEVRGLKIGLISFTNQQPEWEADLESPGVFHVPTDIGDQRTSKLLELVRDTRQRVNLLIVAAHWGAERSDAPPPEHIPLSRELVDAGADVILGHSNHFCRGIEIHRGRPIIYSAGDFIEEGAVDKVVRSHRTFVFALEVEDGLIRQVKLYPVTIRMCQASLATGLEAENIVDHMRRLCVDLGTESRWNPLDNCLDVDVAERAARGALPQLRGQLTPHARPTV